MASPMIQKVERAITVNVDCLLPDCQPITIEYDLTFRLSQEQLLELSNHLGTSDFIRRESDAARNGQSWILVQLAYEFTKALEAIIKG